MVSKILHPPYYKPNREGVPIAKPQWFKHALSGVDSHQDATHEDDDHCNICYCLDYDLYIPYDIKSTSWVCEECEAKRHGQ